MQNDPRIQRAPYDRNERHSNPFAAAPREQQGGSSSSQGGFAQQNSHRHTPSMLEQFNTMIFQACFPGERQSYRFSNKRSTNKKLSENAFFVGGDRGKSTMREEVKKKFADRVDEEIGAKGFYGTREPASTAMFAGVDDDEVAVASGQRKLWQYPVQVFDKVDQNSTLKTLRGRVVQQVKMIKESEANDRAVRKKWKSRWQAQTFSRGRHDREEARWMTLKFKGGNRDLTRNAVAREAFVRDVLKRGLTLDKLIDCKPFAREMLETREDNRRQFHLDDLEQKMR